MSIRVYASTDVCIGRGDVEDESKVTQTPSRLTGNSLQDLKSGNSEFHLMIVVYSL